MTDTEGNNSEELNIWENIKNSRVFIQYVVVLVLMGTINMILNRSYGPLKESFFCINTGSGFITAKRVMWLFTVLVYIAIVGVREWTRKVDYSGTTIEERKEEFKDFALYIVITLATFIFAGAYIRRKFNSGEGKQGGGGNQGILSDTVATVSSTSFGTLALYAGIVIVIINIVSNSYQYLKNRGQNQKDKLLRAIYFAQITTMIIFLITSFFVAGFGCSELQTGSAMTIIIAVIKWGLVISGSIVGVHLINLSTDGENWFGELKSEESNSDTSTEELQRIG